MENTANVTMMAFALSMCADKLRWSRKNKPEWTDTADSDLSGVIEKLKKAGMPDTMQKAFGIDQLAKPAPITDEQLKQMAEVYLK